MDEKSDSTEEPYKGEDQGDAFTTDSQFQPAQMTTDEEVIQNEGPSGGSTTKEFKINIDECSKKDDAVGADPSTNVPEVEFSEEKDAPEITTRVYDFNMVKLKTLPRNLTMRNFCSSQPKSYYLVWGLMGVSIVVCVVVFIIWLTELK